MGPWPGLLGGFVVIVFFSKHPLNYLTAFHCSSLLGLAVHTECSMELKLLEDCILIGSVGLWVVNKQLWVGISVRTRCCAAVLCLRVISSEWMGTCVQDQGVTGEPCHTIDLIKFLTIPFLLLEMVRLVLYCYEYARLNETQRSQRLIKIRKMFTQFWSEFPMADVRALQTQSCVCVVLGWGFTLSDILHMWTWRERKRNEAELLKSE